MNDNMTTVVSVCVDNARCNIKALNDQIGSRQDLSGEFFIGMSCGDHTANLANKFFLFIMKSNF